MGFLCADVQELVVAKAQHDASCKYLDHEDGDTDWDNGLLDEAVVVAHVGHTLDEEGSRSHKVAVDRTDEDDCSISVAPVFLRMSLERSIVGYE